MSSLRVWILVILSAATFVAAEQSGLKHLPGTLWTQARRTLNFSSMFGSATKTAATPYDRIACHPVFQVTTSWGSPYMNFEQVEDPREARPQKRKKGPVPDQIVDGEQMGSRPVALFFMDPDDAIQQHEQMKQMPHMKNTDMRITATTLAKALRQASNLGNGLPTGVPPEPHTGNLKSMDEGGSLRYKIVPPKRQIYYAARCVGRERVGLFGKTAEDDAEMVAGELEALRSKNRDKRREKKDRSRGNALTPAQRASAHMEGHTGIPVFYIPEMRRGLPRVKQLTSGVKQETTLFFSYEDMMTAWKEMRAHDKKGNIPEKPSSVEVFNLWDVLTSMDRNEWVKKQQKVNWKDPMASIRQRFSQKKEPGLESITFVPPSSATKYKEEISAKGNGKARLRPMR